MSKSSSVGRICIVANELTHLFRNGGIGTHNWLLAQALAAEGWNVHILYVADVENAGQLQRCRQLCNAQGITLWHIDEFASPPEDAFICGLGGWMDRHSMHVRRALEQLDAVHHFDLLEFAEWSGYAFRSIQARTMGTSLTGPRIIVKLHASSQWCREANRMWLNGVDDLIRDYYERYSFENADYQLAPSSYMLSYAKSIGWKVRDDASVIRYHYPKYPQSANTIRKPVSGPLELVFFGRLEMRKGLKVFLEVAESLPPEVPVTFLGRECHIDGTPAGHLIWQTLTGRPYTQHTHFDRDQAMAYLSEPNRIAVIPSLTENFPFTVLECAAAGIPFLASNVGGIPEILADSEMKDALLFEPNAKSLRKKIDAYVATTPSERNRYVERMREVCDARRNHETVTQGYVEMLDRPQTLRVVPATQTRSEAACAQQAKVAEEGQPLVSVVVPYYNMGMYLPETLRSLVDQDYPNVEVIVVNDGSTDPYALEVWEEMQLEYPRFRFITQENQGLGAARNAGLAVAAGEYFLPIDSDNIARPEMISRFVQTLEQNPDLAVATCHHLAFENLQDIEEGKFLYAYRPCGGPFVAAALRNVYGDANAMFRTEVLRAAGGYSPERGLGYEDWELFVKLAREGHRIDVIPEYLFYYRHRPGSMLRSTDAYLNRRRVLRQFFTAAELPRAEQIELWMALAGFDENRQQHHQPPLMHVRPEKHRTGMRLAVHRVKGVMKKAPYYATISATLKQFRKRAA